MGLHNDEEVVKTFRLQTIRVSAVIVRDGWQAATVSNLLNDVTLRTITCSGPSRASCADTSRSPSINISRNSVYGARNRELIQRRGQQVTWPSERVDVHA